MQAGTRFTYPGEMEGWVDQVDLYHPSRESNKQPFDHESDAEPLHHQDNRSSSGAWEIELCSVRRRNLYKSKISRKKARMHDTLVDVFVWFYWACDERLMRENTKVNSVNRQFIPKICNTFVKNLVTSELLAIWSGLFNLKWIVPLLEHINQHDPTFHLWHIPLAISG